MNKNLNFGPLSFAIENEVIVGFDFEIDCFFYENDFGEKFFLSKTSKVWDIWKPKRISDQIQRSFDFNFICSACEEKLIEDQITIKKDGTLKLCVCGKSYKPAKSAILYLKLEAVIQRTTLKSAENKSTEVLKFHNPFVDHYSGGIQPRKVISNWKLTFNLGNCLKYFKRAGSKIYPEKTSTESRLIDLNKAKDYLIFEIEDCEEQLKLEKKND